MKDSWQPSVVVAFLVGDPSIMAYPGPCFGLVAFGSAYLVVLAFSVSLAYLASVPFVDVVVAYHHHAFVAFILDGVLVVCYLRVVGNLCCLVVLVHLSFVSRSG